MDYVKKQIKDIEEIIKNGRGDNIYNYLTVLDILRDDYEKVGEKEKLKNLCYSIVDIIEKENVTENLSEEEQSSVNDYLKNAYDSLARNGDFEAFMIAMEWNRPIKQQFYVPRRRVLKKHGFIQALQDLLDRKIKMLVLESPPGIGKANIMSTKIVTPTGYNTFGNLKVGDLVASRDGSFVPITGIYDQGEKDTYKVTFSDGSSTICCKEHLWTVQTKEDRIKRKGDKKHKSSDGKKYRTIELQDIMKDYETIENGNIRHKYSIDYCEPVQFSKKELPLNPYVLGILIGDGGLTNGVVNFTNTEQDIIEKVECLLPSNDCLVRLKNESIKYEIRNKQSHKTSNTKKILISLGLINKYSYEKYIPKDYLLSNVEDRIRFLQGLIDTDGYINENGCTVEYTTVSKQLAEDIKFLVQSLGGRITTATKQGRYKDKYGNKIECRLAYRMNISFSNNIMPCSSIKHLKKYKNKTTQYKRYITNIEYHGKEECRCIMVDHPEHLYLVDDFIVTHNTVLGEFAFAYQYIMHPLSKSLMGGNANMLVTGFYQDILDFLTSPEYRFKEIFPDFPEIVNSAEFKMIYTERKKREPNLMFVSIEVGATGIIHVDGMLYVDDLIKTAEQANNPDQCQKIRYAYTGMLQDRLVNADVPILVIGTMWSINDHISYLKQKYSQESWFRSISVPCMNEERTESNFMYDFGLEKTVEHWERLIRDDDEIIAMAKFFCVAMDREGKLFDTKQFSYFTELPSGEPDRVVAAVDVAYGGGDNYSMPIAYVYGRDVYIVDVIYTKNGIKYSRPATVAKIKKHKISRVHFEGNNGGDLLANDIEQDLKNEGVHCNITHKRCPSIKSKLDRILAVSSQIDGTDTNNNTYKLYFLTKEKQSQEYRKFMSCMSRFSQSLDIQGKQEDDAPDSLANLITNVLGKVIYATVSSNCSRKDMGV